MAEDERYGGIVGAEMIGPRSLPARHTSGWFEEPEPVEGRSVVTAFRPCLECGTQVLCNYDVEAGEARGVPASCAEHN